MNIRIIDREALKEAAQAIATAITSEDGLDGAEGQRVLHILASAGIPAPSCPVKVLDHGFVRLVDHMAGDRHVVDSARVCYRSESVDVERDRKLVRYLLEHEHATPFEHAVFKFHVKAPLFVARQWFRHRSSSYNETSQRYAVVPEQFYVPTTWRAQDAKNKQGSVTAELPHGVLGAHLRNHNEASMALYRQMLDSGVAKELARMVLPVNVYTEWYWTVNARNLMAFIRLRSEHHAQWEMRQYSNALWKLWAPLMPWTAEAFLVTLDLARYAAAPGDALPGPSREDLNRG